MHLQPIFKISLKNYVNLFVFCLALLRSHNPDYITLLRLITVTH